MYVCIHIHIYVHIYIYTYVYYNTLQHTATCYNTPQHAATHLTPLCSQLPRPCSPRVVSLTHCKNNATCYETRQNAATRCDTLQHATTRCNMLQHAATRCNTLQNMSHLYSHHFFFSVTLTAHSLSDALPKHSTTQHSTAPRCNTLQPVATPRNTLLYTATHLTPRHARLPLSSRSPHATLTPHHQPL